MPARRRPYRPARRPWRALTRAQRKRRYIQARNNIRLSRAYFRGLYHTSDSLAPGRGWIDLVFLSRKRKGDYYNVTLETAFCAFSEKLSDLAWELNPRLDGFEAARSRLAAEGAVSVRERCEIDFSYTAGVGLHATIDAPYLSPEAVERFVSAFLDGGEIGFEGSEPLSWSAEEASSELFSNPVGEDFSQEPWACDLLLRNRALDEALALAQSLQPARRASGRRRV